jgi:hypothetical protein
MVDPRSKHVNFERHRQIILETEVSLFPTVPGRGLVLSDRGDRTADQSLILGTAVVPALADCLTGIAATASVSPGTQHSAALLEIDKISDLGRSVDGFRFLMQIS